ncbi:folate family ECF transporter S component [Fructobacillus sp. M2-14]|uniref:Folate family ECF transporter S component n=1 Tax=Fructobacillus broussonetiae TaxID=2713173 RepID=A0ABS5R266_9LACO|nr:folate family ECF transporter S component [Fructobacillus broussonetiae]MBS9339122.1 folate family ECF transporter S component [Fructobacillus broussonetiae]
MNNQTRTSFKVWALPKLTVQQLVLLSVLIAMSFILGRLSITTQILRISFVFLASSLMGKFFGPLWTAMTMVLLDFVKTTFFGGGHWSPVMAIGVLLAGLIYGSLFYQEKQDAKVAWWKVILAVLLITIVVNLIINTAALTILYSAHKSWSVYFSMMATRLPKNIIFFPIQLVMTYFVLNNPVVHDISKRFFKA